MTTVRKQVAVRSLPDNSNPTFCAFLYSFAESPYTPRKDPGSRNQTPNKMHFWIDKRSQSCGFGRARVAASLAGGGIGFGHHPRRLGGKSMMAPIHRYPPVEYRSSTSSSTAAAAATTAAAFASSQHHRNHNHSNQPNNQRNSQQSSAVSGHSRAATAGNQRNTAPHQPASTGTTTTTMASTAAVPVSGSQSERLHPLRALLFQRSATQTANAGSASAMAAQPASQSDNPQQLATAGAVQYHQIPYQSECQIPIGYL